jgi:2-C-methyl-D-erythritol 4-phosphate cytidylyltransferase
MKTFNSIYVSQDGEVVNSVADREVLYRGQAPEAMPLGKLAELCAEAEEKGLGNTVAGMLISLGRTVHLSLGSERNFKITTQDDIDMFKTLNTLPPTQQVVKND